MAHIQIAKEPVGKWINTDMISYVTGTKEAVAVYIGAKEFVFRGPDAATFLEAYERLCVAKPRPEVG